LIYPKEDFYLLQELEQTYALQRKSLNPGDIFSSINEKKNLMIGCVREITKDFKIKLFVLPNEKQVDSLNDKNMTWQITKLSNSSTIDKTCESLEAFCSKNTMVTPLFKLILCPNNSDQRLVKELATTKIKLDHKPTFNFQTNLNES
jgi:hypothetical protein